MPQQSPSPMVVELEPPSPKEKAPPEPEEQLPEPTPAVEVQETKVIEE